MNNINAFKPHQLPKIYKAMYKNELAERAGVSYSTFFRWMKKNEKELLSIGLDPKSRLLPPKIVKWICEQYGIDV